MNTPTKEQILSFLINVDNLFPVALSKKQNLKDFADKLFQKSTLCTVIEDENIVAMVAGYTENTPDNLGYISIVAVLPCVQGTGVAKKLVTKFLDISRNRGLNGVHLYSYATNHIALNLYKNLGFRQEFLLNEPRPQDIHLFYYFNKE